MVRAGGRLSQPKACPVDMYQLMNWCWQKSAKKRPNFAQLVVELTKFATADGVEAIRVRLFGRVLVLLFLLLFLLLLLLLLLPL